MFLARVEGAIVGKEEVWKGAENTKKNKRIRKTKVIDGGDRISNSGE